MRGHRCGRPLRGAGSQFASHLHTEAVVVFLNDYGADGVGVGALETGDVVHLGGYSKEDVSTGGQIVGAVGRMVGDDVEDGQPVGGFVCCVSIDVYASAMVGRIGTGHLEMVPLYTSVLAATSLSSGVSHDVVASIIVAAATNIINYLVVFIMH